LLTVVAIMAIMMGITVTAYFGLGRGAAMTGAVLNVRTVLSHARQLAVSRRARTYVMFKQEGDLVRYLVCAEDGVHVGDGGSALLKVSGPRWEADSLVDGTVYNLGKTPPQRGIVTQNSDRQLEATGVQWDPGDRCGWVVGDQGRLDPGVKLNNATALESPIVFKPDGTTPSLQNRDVELWDIQNVQKKTVVVKGLSGHVYVESS
jgi:hypothetical protein